MDLVFHLTRLRLNRLNSSVFNSSPTLLVSSTLSSSPLGYSPAWDVCSLLGQCEGYADLDARRELLAFSLTHCPPDNIHGLLAASSDLQTQVPLSFTIHQNSFFTQQPKNCPHSTGFLCTARLYASHTC